MRRITIVEGKEQEVAKGLLPERELKYLIDNFGSQISVSSPILKDYYVLKSDRYVGQVRISEEIEVRIESKVPISNLWKMVDYGFSSDKFQILKGTVEVDTIEDVFGLHAFRLAELISDRARRGLHHSYKEQTKLMPVVRGRIRVAETLRAMTHGSVNLCCEFEQHTDDLDDNRILIWTLYCLSTLRFKQEVVESIRRAYRALAGSIALQYITADECVNRTYTRLNEDYKPMHLMCHFFLENLGPTFKRGADIFPSFKTLDMWTLFQRFVVEWLRENAHQYDFITHDVPLQSSESSFSFRPDIIVKDRSKGEVITVLDTKYKDATTPQPEDIHQAVAYAKSLNVPKAFLVYPSTISAPFWVEVGDVRVESLVFDISSPDLDLSGARFLINLESALM